MKLRLFKHPYCDPLHQGAARFLFESKTDPELIAGGPHDFYLYVWIRETDTVEAFQIVLAEQAAANFTNGKPVNFGLIRREPINRAIHIGNDEASRNSIRLLMPTMESDEFPEMISAIGTVVLTESESLPLLCESEAQLFQKLLASKVH